MSRKSRARRYYTAPDKATDDLYEALMYHYWQAQELSRELLVDIADKYEAGGYSVEAQPKEKEATSFPPEDDTESVPADDVDYDDAASIGDNYPWDGWRFKNVC